MSDLVTIEREAYAGKSARCTGDWMDSGKCRKVARNVVTITSYRKDGPTLSGTSRLCVDCSDRCVRNYVREYRSELARFYFGSLVIDGETVDRDEPGSRTSLRYVF